jgi:hypothetical protein
MKPGAEQSRELEPDRLVVKHELTVSDADIVIRDGRELTGPLRIEGSRKELIDNSN